MFSYFRGKSKDKSPGRLNDDDYVDTSRGRASSRGPVGFGSDDMANGTMPKEASHLAPPANVGGVEASPSPTPSQEGGEGRKSERREKSEKKEKKHRKRDKEGFDAQWGGDWGATGDMSANAGQWGGDWNADMGPGGHPPEQQSRRHKSRSRSGIEPPSPGPSEERRRSRKKTLEADTENMQGMMMGSEAVNYQATQGYQQPPGYYPGMQGAIPLGQGAIPLGMPGQMQQPMDGQYPGYQGYQGYPGMEAVDMGGQQATWQCSKCTLINPITATKCEACGAPRPASIPGAQSGAPPAQQQQHPQHQQQYQQQQQPQQQQQQQQLKQQLQQLQQHQRSETMQSRDSSPESDHHQQQSWQGNPQQPWQGNPQQPESMPQQPWQGNPQQQPSSAPPLPWQANPTQQPWQAQPMTYTPPASSGPYYDGGYSQGMTEFYSQTGSVPVTPITQEQYLGINSTIFKDSRRPSVDASFQSSNTKRRDSFSWLGKPYRPISQESTPVGTEQQGPTVAASMPNMHVGSGENTQFWDSGRRLSNPDAMGTRNSLNGVAPSTTGNGAFDSRNFYSLPSKAAPKLDLDWAKPTAIAWNTEGGRRKGPDLGWAQVGSPPGSLTGRKAAFEDPVIWTGLPSSQVVKLGSEYQGGDEQKQRSEELIGILQEEVKSMKRERDSQQETVAKQLQRKADAAIQQLQNEAKQSILQLQGEVKYQEQRQAALVEQMHNELREQEREKDVLLEKLQVEMRQKEQQKEAIVFHLQDELRQREQQKELEVQQLQGEIKLKEHEKETIVQQLQAEIHRLHQQQHDSLVLHLQDEVNRMKVQTPVEPPDTSPWDNVSVGVEGLDFDGVSRLPSFGPSSSGTFEDNSPRLRKRSLEKIPEDSPWKILVDEMEQYRDVFVSLDICNNGTVGAEEARGLFDRSGLSSNELSTIWRASDVDGDSLLSKIEFICAMAIVKRRKEGVELPSEAPAELMMQIKYWESGGKSVSSAPVPIALPAETIAMAYEPAALGFTSPTSKASSAPPADSPWAATKEEIQSYQEIFLQHETGGIADPAKARAVLEQSNLPGQTLSKIWQLADVDGDGNLIMVEFIYAMALVARHLQGAPLPDPLPSELIASVSAAGLRGFWSPTPEELERFRVVFDSLGCAEVGGGSVGPKEGGELLDRSRLPKEERVKIWQFADADCDGRLAPGEFICAMTLVARRLQGAELPDKLPGELRMYTGVQKDLVPPMSAIPMPMPSSPSSSSPTSPSPSSTGGSPIMQVRTAQVASSSSTSSAWVVTPDELERWRVIFAEHDTGSGLIGPLEARKVLEGSGLPTEDLSRIWDLSDVRDPPGELSVGEFICAMALVKGRRRKVSLPSMLPPELEVYVGGPGGLVASSAPASEESWRVTPDELQRFQRVFKEKNGSGDGSLSAEAARPTLESSNLPPEDLAHIWTLADRDGDGRLTQPEFIWAMTLVLRRRNGSPLPQKLPQALIDSVPKR